MKSFTSIIFLVLFATALAVPAGIFYNKWANKKADEAALQVPGQKVSTAAIFSGSQDKNSAPAEEAGGPAASAVSQSGQREAANPDPAGASARGGENRTAETTVTASTYSLKGAYFNPKSGRDPTISKAEYTKMKEDAEKQIAAEKKKLLESRHQERTAGGENLIRLTGIVGQNAIINNEMYAVGNIVRGVKVKILKITPSYIVCEYNGKRFTKIMR